jgi:hypothetical protein
MVIDVPFSAGGGGGGVGGTGPSVVNMGRKTRPSGVTGTYCTPYRYEMLHTDITLIRCYNGCCKMQQLCSYSQYGVHDTCIFTKTKEARFRSHSQASLPLLCGYAKYG